MNEQTKFCIKCGTPYTVGTNFCANCGEKLNVYTEVPDKTSDEHAVPPEFNENTNKQPIGILIFVGLIAVIVLILIIVAFNIKENPNSYYNNSYESSYYNSDITYPETEEELSFGTVSKEGVYENKFFGIKCVFPEWTYRDEQGLKYSKELANSLFEDLSDSKNSEVMSLDEDSQYTVHAIHPNGITNVNIVIRKNDDNMVKNLSEKTILYALAPEVYSMYKEMGILGDYEVFEHNINGKTKYVLCNQVDIYGYEYTILQFIVLKQDYFLLVTITAETKEEAFEVCNSIYLE